MPLRCGEKGTGWVDVEIVFRVPCIDILYRNVEVLAALSPFERPTADKVVGND